MINSIEEKILNGECITEQEALQLSVIKDKEALYDCAHRITEHFMGNVFDTCSIINAKSGNCPENCKWCAQSAHFATEIEKYALVNAGECVAQSKYNHNQGIGRFSLVASGRTATSREIESMAVTYKMIKKNSPNLKCCASLGLLDEEKLQKLFDSGVTTYHCNMETAPSHFHNLCTTHTQQDKEATLRAARKVGMRICSGGIIGMGETMEQRIEFAFYLNSIGTLSIPINILQPIPGTPLEHAAPLSDEEYLTTVALFRLINPHAFLRFSGGRAQISRDIQKKAIYIGINSAITGDLLTTIGSQAREDMSLIQEMGKINTNHKDWEVSYDH
ncbi:biotin synthase BioB [Porphyromonas pogonae]|uniref:biotin synthase BioB n=1 Tax=Porphyromonas pogonae TaxID=867595 RepID=UPI002E780C3C|nr:biotin synthase BioB [Porphyromonas pogonae]